MACSRCSRGFFHYECLVNVAADVANTAMDRTMCIACARAHNREIQRKALLDSGLGKTRRRGAGSSGPPVKRVVPTDAQCVAPKRRSTGQGWCPAGISRNCTSTPSVHEEDACRDWHVHTESSCIGSNVTPGTWSGRPSLTAQLRPHVQQIAMVLCGAYSLADSGFTCAQTVIPMSRARSFPTWRGPMGLGERIRCWNFVTFLMRRA